MRLMDAIHSGYVFPRRVRILSEHLARLVPEGATVLDVGCGDGLLDELLSQRRPDLTIRGIEVLIRKKTYRPIELYDGKTIPFPAKSVDAVMLVDALHHSEDPRALLAEAVRVARRAIVLKDHMLAGFLAGPTLRFMDRVGNARHGIALPYHYWTYEKWMEACAGLGLTVAAWEKKVGLYPWWASWAFDRELQFAARLEVAE